MTVPASPRRRRIRRAAALVAVGAVALPAAAFAIPSISGTDGAVINPALQSPDFTIGGTGTVSWAVAGTGLGGSGAAPVNVDVDGLAEDSYTLQAIDDDLVVTSRSFTVDTTAPFEATVLTPSEGATFDVGEIVSLSYICSSDATCTPSNGSAVNTSTPGPKTITVTAEDTAGNQTATVVHYTVVDSTPVDNAPPTGGSLTAPAVTNNPAISVTAGAASDPSTPITYALVQGPAAPAAGAYGASLPTGITLTGADGTKNIHLWAKDAAGNAGKVASASVLLDRAGPDIAIASPDAGASYALGQVVPADYSCADGAGLASCAGPVQSGAAIDTGSLGSKQFTVTATDGAGNTSTKTVSYTVGDTVDPTITIVSPKAQKYEVNTLQLASFTCDDNAPGVSCQSTTANGDPLDTANLGEHTFTVQATDTSGNTTTKQVTYEVVDSHDPEAPGLVSPPDNTVTNQLRPKLNWLGSDDPGVGGAPGSGIDGYDVFVDGKVVASVAAGTTNWMPDEDMKTGNHTWRVRARDKAGNATSSEIFNFKVDPNATEAPVFTAAPPAATNDNTPSFAWTGTSGVQEYHWALRQGTDTVSDGLLTAATPSLDMAPLNDGDYVFTVTQRTNGIHGTAAAHPFTVDTVAPGLLTIVVRPPGSSDDITPLFAWAGGEPGARYLWQLSGPGGVIVQGPTETPLNAALLTVAPGAYVFQVRQVDAAGNPSPLTVPEPFTVVGGAPPGGGTTTIPTEPKVADPVITPPKKTVKQVRPVPTTRNVRALFPKVGARITSLRPVLRWKARKGATLYNVQVFRLKGTKLTKVVTAFPRGLSYRVPRGKLKVGFRYVWRVWPYVNRSFPNQPLGVSYFDVTPTAKALARSHLLAPAGISARAGRALTVRWAAKAGSAAYKVQVLRGAKVAFEQIATVRTLQVPATAMGKGAITLRVLASKGASQTAFAGSAWAQADLKIR
jgi:hypothetical protein